MNYWHVAVLMRENVATSCMIQEIVCGYAIVTKVTDMIPLKRLLLNYSVPLNPRYMNYLFL